MFGLFENNLKEGLNVKNAFDMANVHILYGHLCEIVAMAINSTLKILASADKDGILLIH